MKERFGKNVEGTLRVPSRSNLARWQGTSWPEDSPAQPLHVQVDPKQAAFACFRPDAAGDEQLIVLWAAEGHVAGRRVAAVVLADQLSRRIEHLHLLHAVVGDIQIARRIEAHAVRLVV